MDNLTRAKRDLVIANRILANQGVIDASGHVSLRHPDNQERFLISRSRSPELVDLDDIVEMTLDGRAIDDSRALYLERFVHGSIYEARTDAQAVVHSHLPITLPFGLTSTTFQPVIHLASDIGYEIPVWDIADKFGDGTDLYVTNTDHGRDLAQSLGNNRMVLMRGHGFSAVSHSIVLAVRMCVYLPRNARVLLAAMKLGEVKPLNAGEIEVRLKSDPNSPDARRSWDYWAKKAGCENFL